MKPAWDQLGDEYAASSSVVIGDVDCTADGQSLCEKFEIRGYPTIKYFVDGDTTTGKDYQGGRDFDSLQAFVTDTLEVLCDANNPDANGSSCTDKEKSYINKMKAKGMDDITKQLTRLENMKGDKMKADLKVWLNQRINILRTLKGDDDDELDDTGMDEL